MNRDSSKNSVRSLKPLLIAVEPAFPAEAEPAMTALAKRPVVKPATSRVRDSLVLRVVVKNPAGERQSDHERAAH